MAGAKAAAVARVAAKGYWRAADARVVVEAWTRSGEPLREYATRYGIDPRRLRRWARRLEAPAEPSAAEEPVRFHPVRLVAKDGGARRCAEPIEIAFVEGGTVRVPPGFAAEDLERVLAVLGVGAC